MGIYKITNWATDKFYIGSAINIEQRWRVHRSDLKLQKHTSITLQRSYNKYGLQVFIFEILELLDNKADLLPREQFYLNSLNPCNPAIGYNINPIAGSKLGTKERPESTALRIAKLKGRKQSPEEIAKRVAANTGKKRTEESKARQSAVKKGKLFSDAHKANLSKSHIGIRQKEETKEKIRQTMLSKKFKLENV